MAFTSIYDDDAISKYASLYSQHPSAFTPEQAVTLRDEAEARNIPFALTDEHHNTTLGSLLGQAAQGYLEGFTTYHSEKNAPDDEWERLARRVGNLFGFMGLVPPLRRFMPNSKIVQGLSKLPGNSLPLIAANRATEAVGKRVFDYVKAAGGGEHAKNAAIRFLTGEKGRNLASGAFHLGVASGISNWQGGVDEMMEGFLSGAGMGTAFRGIGMMKGMGNPVADKAVRSLAASLYTGLPSTIRGETTPEQVFSYIEGAFFGWGEKPAAEHAAAKFLKNASITLNQKSFGERSELYDPKNHEGWTDLSAEARDIVTTEFSSKLRGIEWAVQRMVADGVIDPDVAEEMARNLVSIDTKEAEAHERSLEEQEMDEYRRRDAEATPDANVDSEFSGGVLPEDIKINRSIESLVDHKLRDVIKPGARLNAKIDFSREEERIFNDKVEQPAQTFIDYIEKYTGTSLDDTTRGQLRQRVNQRIRQYKPSFVTVEYGEANDIQLREFGRLGPDGSVLRTNMEKPRSVQAYEEAATRLGQDVEPGALAIFDHIASGTQGKITLDMVDDFLLQRVRNAARRESKTQGGNPREIAERMAGEKKSRLYGEVFSNMRESGYYYTGGRGDAPRMYFMKWHPETPNDPASVKMLINDFYQRMGYTAEEIATENDARDDFISQTKMDKAGEYYDYSTLSNILYELEMNGFKGWQDLDKYSSGSFIRGAKAWNKRQQIWYTAGWALDPTFSGYASVPDIVDGKIEVEHRFDFKPPEGEESGPNATEYTEATDGSIAMRKDLLQAMLRDTGVPVEGLFGKSFIIEPDSELGALLAKYGVHPADEATEAYLEANGLHAIMYESASKQRGHRQGRFKVALSSFKAVPSEFSSKHSIENQRVAKQLLTNLTEFAFSLLGKGSINGMIDELFSRGYDGTVEANAIVPAMRAALEKGTGILPSDVDAFTRSIDDISLPSIFHLVRSKGGDKLADAFYRHVLRVESDDIREAKEEGEATDFEVADADRAIEDYKGIYQVLSESAPGELAVWQHKAVRPYVEKAVLNYVVKRVVRPKIENSGTFRLAQYTHEMALTPRTAALQTNRNIFLLNDGHRQRVIKSSLLQRGKMELGDIIDNLEWDVDAGAWKARGNMFKNNIDQINELLRAVVVRVPMGSLSGAHVLRFGGFTGIGGFGGVAHGETVRAIGGADLDGDKAFYFFGDHSNGFKPEWKDMYAANRDEFLERDPDAQVVAVTKIISGGQTGGDEGGLLAGHDLGLETGGTAPPGWIRGGKSEKEYLEGFGLEEGEPDPAKFPKRTMKNVDDADGTIAFIVGPSVGTAKTIGYAKFGKWRSGAGSSDSGHRPVLEVKSLELTEENVKQIANFIRRNNIKTLNVAGHRESSQPGITEKVRALVREGVLAARGGSNEFLETGKGRLPDLKKEYRNIFVNSGPTKDFIDNTPSMFSPHVRRLASEAAYMGRNSLKDVVTARSISLSAHSSLMGMGGRYSLGEAVLGKGKEPEEIFIEARSNPADMKEFQKFSRAAIELTADPMDEPGLLPGNTMASLIKRRLFKWVDAKGNEIDPSTIRAVDRGGDSPAMGFHKLFGDVNSALYSRNYREGRRWVYEEIQGMLGRMNDAVPIEASNSLFPRLAKVLHGLDWTDGMSSRLNTEGIINIMNEVNRLHKSGEYRYLKELFKRSTLDADMRGISAFMKLGLHTSNGWDREMREGELDRELHLKLFKDEKSRNYWANTVPGRAGWRKRRESMMIKAKARYEDFISNDIATVTTMVLAHKYVQRIKMEHPESWEEIVDNVREATSYLRGQVHATIQSFKAEEAATIAESGEKMASSMRRLNIDKVIGRTKAELARMISNDTSEALPSSVRKLFDHMILGTYDVGTTRFDRWKRIIEDQGGIMASELLSSSLHIKVPGKDRMIEPEEAFRLINEKSAALKEYTSDVKSTRYLRFGFESALVGKDSIAEHMRTFSKFFKIGTGDGKSMRELHPELKKAEENIRVSQYVEDEGGNRTHVNLLDLSEESPAEQVYRDARKPFETGEHVESYPELVSEYTKLKEHLEHYPHIRSGLHYVVREMFGKDLNVMTIGDLKALNTFFSSARRGSFVSRLIEAVKGPGDNGLKRWYWNIFPDAISRDTMKKFMFGVRKKGIFFDKDGVKVVGNTMIPTGAMGYFVHRAGYYEEMKTRVTEQVSGKVNDDLYPYVHGIEDGPVLFSYAIARAEYEGKKKDMVGDSVGASQDMATLRKRYEEELSIAQNAGVLNKTYQIGGKTLSGDQVARAIEGIVGEHFAKMHTWLTGDPTLTDRFIMRGEAGEKLYHKTLYGEDAVVAEGAESDLPIYDPYQLTLYFANKADASEAVPMEIGLRTMNDISRSILASKLAAAGQYEAYNDLIFRESKEVGWRPGYWPHIMYSNMDKVTKAYEERIKEILDREPVSKAEEKQNIKEMRKATLALRQLAGDITVELPTQAYWDKFEAMMEKAGGNPRRDAIKWEDTDHRVGAMESRTMHLDGWEISPAVIDLYSSRIVGAFNRAVAQIHFREMIGTVERLHAPIMKPEVAKAWSGFFRLYVNNSLGFPAILPDELASNPNMKVDFTPYSWMNDLTVKRALNRMVKKLNLDKSTHASIKALKDYEKVDYKTVMWLSNLEAKYQMAALLAHPKTATANIFGGETSTVISAGFRNVLKANSIKYLRMINPEWRSMEDVDKFVRLNGVIEEYLLKEAQFNPAFKSAKHQQFLRDLTAAVKKDPDVSNEKLTDLAKRHGIMDAMFEKAAWFMKVSERKVRRDSFMAHYIQARERLGDALPFDHPILIEMAKKGVRATQFMYSNTYRPMFAQTALGKVLTRFQMYAWNSVKFRNDIIREASYRGFEEGTIEFDRFKRMAVIDMVSLALASAFTYSLFDSNLPQPYSWIQDLSNWMFGDEDARDKAFFGSYPVAIAPLQAITPPILRMVGPTMKAVLTRDWEKVADYHVWSLFPFGRVGRDLIGPNNVFENPHQLIEKVTGFPLIKFSETTIAVGEEMDKDENKGDATR